jgi:hypothetical protein
MGDSAEQVVRTPPDGSLTEDEHAELARLRAEVSAYRDRGDGTPPGPRRARSAWRSIVAVVLIVVGCLLAPLSVVGVWARDQIGDTDRYLANVTPLAADPGVQNALADRITNEIFGYVDLRGIVDQTLDVLVARGLPASTADRLRGLSGPLANGVRGFVRGKVGEMVASRQFQDAWVTANRVAHEQLVAALSGKQGSVGVSEGTVSVDLGPFIAAAKQSLVSAGFTAVARIPDIHPKFELFSSRYLQRAQSGYRLLDRLGTALPLVSLALILLGVYLARGHRRALVGAGLGLALSMILLGSALVVGRSVYLDTLPDTVSAPTAVAVFDTLVRFLRTGLRMVLVLGLVVAAGAFLSGPSATAVSIRGGSSTALGRLRERGEAVGLRTGPVGAWVHGNLKMLRLAVLCAAAVVFVFWDRPTGKVVLVLAGFVVLALAVLQFLARPPHAAAAEHSSAR